MKKIRMFVCLLLASIIMVSYPVQAAGISTCAWPGRPGGNGDGSEEWLQGNYGETNGPYKLVSTQKGPIDDLKTPELLQNVATGIAGAAANKIDARLGTVLTAAGIVAALGSEKYNGAYYISKSYISGRRMKTVITTYLNSDYTGYVETHTHYIVW